MSGTTTTAGNLGTKKGTNHLPPYTNEQLAQMSIDEINANWEDVKESLRIIYDQQQKANEERS